MDRERERATGHSLEDTPVEADRRAVKCPRGGVAGVLRALPSAVDIQATAARVDNTSMFGLVVGGGTRTTSLRRAAAILVIAVAVVLSGNVVRTAGAAVGDCTASPSWGTVDASLEAQVVQLVNAHRNAMGLGSLTVSTSLTASAEWKSLHMAAYSYLAHDDPAPPVARTVAQRLDACGYPSGAAGWGENIAYYYPDAASVMAAWLGDAGHKANIENPSWKTIGVGVARSGSGPIYWTQDFGTTGASSPPSAPAPQADTQPPSVPGGLGLSASGATLNVSWQPSSDDVGVAGYDIFLNGNRLGIVQTTTGSISGAACGTAYAVGVDAFDAAGNHSAVSSATTQTTPCASASPPQPVPQPVTPASGASSGASSPPGSSGNQSAAGQTGAQQTPAGQSGGQATTGPSAVVPLHPIQPLLRVVARTGSRAKLRWPKVLGAGSGRYHVLVDGVARLVVKGTEATLSGVSCGKAHTVKIVPLGASPRVSNALTLVIAAKPCSRP